MSKKAALAIATLAAASTALAGTVTTEGDDLVINLKGPVEIKSADGDYAVKLGGRLQWDYNYAELNGEADEDEFDVRRARMYMSGKVRDWSYKMQFNIGDGNGGSPEDLYVRYNGWGKKAIVTVGKQKEAFGLEELTSSKDITFLERSAITEAYAPGRSEGIQFSGVDGDFTYAIGVFEDDTAGGDDAAITGRMTYNPLKDGDSVVHLGLAYSDRAAGVETTGLEAAYSDGPFHVQAEYQMADTNGGDFDGYYVQAGWIITGESRPYKNGVFKRVKPNDPSGAWELVVRYEDQDGNYSDIELGNTDATAYGVGLNYYLNKFIRVGATYTKGDDNQSSDDGSEFRARLQIAL